MHLGRKPNTVFIIACLLLGAVASAIILQPAKAMIYNPNKYPFLGTQTFTSSYYQSNYMNCEAYTGVGVSGNTEGGWSWGVCPYPPSLLGPNIEPSNGLAQLWTQSVSVGGGGSSGELIAENHDLGTIVDGVASYQTQCSNGGSCYSMGCSNNCVTGTDSQGGIPVSCNPVNAPGINECNSFYVPNYGQTFTPVDFSTDVYIYGGINAYTTDTCLPIVGCFGSANAEAQFAVNLVITETSPAPQSWTLSIVNDDAKCSTSGSTCNQSYNYQKDYQPSTTFNLPPGSYTTELDAEIYASSSAGLSASGNAYSCFYINSACIRGPESGTCPTGVNTSNSYCQFIQWKSTTYTFHYPDYSLSNYPTSVSLNAGSSVTIPFNVNSIQIENNNAYSLSTQVWPWITFNDPNLQWSLSSSTGYTPPAGGSISGSITISDAYTCDSGTISLGLGSGVMDIANLLPAQQQHLYTISLTINPTCKFSISAAPSSLSISQGGSSTVTISLTSFNGFSGTVSLSAGSPGGICVCFNPSSVTLQPGGTVSLSVPVTTLSISPTGTYTVAIYGSGGNTLMSTNLTVTITTPPGGGGGGGGGGGPPRPMSSSG